MEQPDSIYFFKTTAKEKHCADEQKWKKKKQNYRSNHSVEYLLLVEKEPDKLAKKAVIERENRQARERKKMQLCDTG